jgi:SAM-dependent methyltransferase
MTGHADPQGLLFASIDFSDTNSPMAQRISRLYHLVTLPRFYACLQDLLGGSSSRRRFFDEIVCSRPGMKVLDVGCGPASLFPYLADTQYTGIDLNPQSIDHAKRLHGNRGRFLVGDAAAGLPDDATDFDLIIVSALLHHLDDSQARTLFSHLSRRLRTDGRIVTIDNVWLPEQHFLAKIANRLDSGLNVRTPEQYTSLVTHLPLRVEQRVYRDLLRIPYDHFCMTLTPQPTAGNK